MRSIFYTNSKISILYSNFEFCDQSANDNAYNILKHIPQTDLVQLVFLPKNQVQLFEMPEIVASLQSTNKCLVYSTYLQNRKKNLHYSY